MWVPLVETGEADGPGADYFVKKYVDECMAADPDIDTLILGCTHYPRLTCEFIYNVETARAIGGACVVTEIEIVIIRQSPSDFP